MLTVVHVVVTSVHHRRRDVAVLRALGADGGWVTGAVQWQATSFTLVPLALAVPLGLSAGRLAFGEFADRVGAVPSASFPFLVPARSAPSSWFSPMPPLPCRPAGPACRARRPSPAPLLAPE